LVAMFLATWAIISPSSLRVVFFAAICREYTTAVGRCTQARREWDRASNMQNRRRPGRRGHGRRICKVAQGTPGDGFANCDRAKWVRRQAMDLQSLPGALMRD
jgi:hypothetical protein